MADPLQTTVQVQDVPEYLRDYRSALLNAAFRTVFNPKTNWFQQQFPNATYTTETGAPSAPAAGGSTGDTRTDQVQADSGVDKSGIAGTLAPKTPKLLGLVWDAKTRTWVPEAYKSIVASMAEGGALAKMDAGGNLAEEVARNYQRIRDKSSVEFSPEQIQMDPLEEMYTKLSGQVSYPGRTGPFGNELPSSPTSGWSTGTRFRTSPEVYNPVPDVGRQITPPSPGTAPGQPSQSAQSSTRPAVSGAPPIGAPASAAVLPQFIAGLAGTTSENRGAGGYNPAQYATDEQARGLASLLGGTTARTNPIGPVAPPPQNLISFGGQDALNAGLVQQMLGPIAVDGVSRPRTASEMSLSLAGLRDEVARSGGDTSQVDALIAKNNAAYASGAGSSPVGQPPPGPPASGARTAVPSPTLSTIDQSVQNMLDILGQINSAQAGKKAGGGSLAQFEIGDDGKVRNYRKGGAIRKVDGGGFGPTSTGTGSGTATTPAPGPNILGFGTAQTPSTGGIANFWNTANPSATGGANLFNPPAVYGGQRVLGFGQDFGQYTPDVGFTSSRMTKGALSGLENLPSIFKQYDVPATGTTPAYSYTAIDRNTDFGKGLSKVNWATDIASDAATAGLDLLSYTGIGPSGVTRGPQSSYLMGMMPSIQKMGFQGPISVSELSSPEMQAAMGVSAGKTEVGSFGQPVAEAYMSPYQQSVTELQKRDARRQFEQQKAARDAAAVRAGAFGGSRQAVQEGMAEEALQRQLGDIEAVGRQKAFEGAQAQFERDRAASLASQQANLRAALEAQMANQQAGLTSGQANLQAALATQQLGTQAGLEAAKASQAGDLATWQMQLDAIKQASAEEQAARQQDFSQKLAALGQVQSGAAGLAGLGGTMMNIPALAQQLELQRLAALQQGGGAVDVRTQQALDLAYQDFINQQNFPYQQMNFLQGILSGVPVGMQYEGVQFQRPSAGGLTGLLTSGAGLLSNIYNK